MSNLEKGQKDRYINITGNDAKQKIMSIKSEMGACRSNIFQVQRRMAE